MYITYYINKFERKVFIISKYSGKCDFKDMCEIHNIDNILKSNVYIGWNIIPLKFESEKDLIPYYPYIVGSSSTTNGVGEIRLSTESYVDRSERESLEFYTKACQKYVNKCKRKKEFCDIGHFNKENNYGYNEVYEEIISRLMMVGFEKDFKFTLDGIYLPMAERYRKELYDEMIKNGWDENKSKRWCFGWRKEYPI